MRQPSVREDRETRRPPKTASYKAFRRLLLYLWHVLAASRVMTYLSDVPTRPALRRRSSLISLFAVLALTCLALFCISQAAEHLALEPEMLALALVVGGTAIAVSAPARRSNFAPTERLASARRSPLLTDGCLPQRPTRDEILLLVWTQRPSVRRVQSKAARLGSLVKRSRSHYPPCLQEPKPPPLLGGTARSRPIGRVVQVV